MAQSYVAAAVSRLYTAVKAVMDAQSPPVACYLGPPTGVDVPSAYVAVAYTTEDRPAVVGSRERQTHSEHWAEQFDVWIAVSTASGDENGPVQLAATEALYALTLSAITADRTLGGLLVAPGMAEPGAYEWTVEDGGQIVTVFFIVRCTVVWGQ